LLLLLLNLTIDICLLSNCQSNRKNQANQGLDDAQEPPPFEGTFQYASREALGDALLGKPRYPVPADELDSLVKTVMAVNSGQQRIWDWVSAIPQGNFFGHKNGNGRASWNPCLRQQPIVTMQNSINYR
jgi:hypothetical protein